MPEYSTPKLTPDETTKLPGMNGSSSGYVLTSELLDIIRSTFGQANGVATLDGSGKLPTAQLPDIADDVLVYASKALLPAQGVEAKIYITTDDNVLYRWDATLGDYVQLSVDLSDYATLDDLSAEESARETADANLNNALTAIDHRVQNLEQSKGDYVVSNYKDGAITPSGKGAWAVVEGLRGVSRVENGQLVPTLHAGSINNGITPSYNASTQTMGLSGTSTGTFDAILIDASPILTPGHTYIVALEKSATGFTFTDNYQALSNTASYVFTAGAGNPYFNIRARGNAGVTLDYEGRIGLTDLNIYFNTSDLSFLGATDSAKLATIQKDYPHLLLPSEYGQRIVDSSYSGVRAWSRNIFDEQTESGKYDASGNKEIDHNRIRCVNPLPVTANTTYYIKIGNYAGNYCAVFEYDADGNFIQMITPNASTHLFTTSGNCRYITFFLSDLYGTTYKNDVCINVSDSLNGTYTPYHAPNTLSLSFQGKSAGGVHDTYEPNVEVGGVAKKRTTERVGSVVFDGSDDENWTKGSGNNFYFQLNTLIKAGQEGYANRLLCDKLIPVINQASTDFTQGTKVITGYRDSGNLYPNQNWLYVRIDDTITSASALKTWLAQNPLTVYYELAEESITLSDPILDNTLLTESGGRMATVQNGTVIDGSFDMGFINL